MCSPEKPALAVEFDLAELEDADDVVLRGFALAHAVKLAEGYENSGHISNVGEEVFKSAEKFFRFLKGSA